MGHITLRASSVYRWVSLVETGQSAHPDYGYNSVGQLSARDLGPYFVPLSFVGWLQPGEAQPQTKQKSLTYVFESKADEGALTFAQLRALLEGDLPNAHRAKRLLSLIEKRAAKREISDKDREKVEKQLAQTADDAETIYLDEVKLVPASIARFSAAKRLCVSGSKLSTIADEAFALPALDALELDINDLPALPPSIGEAAGLRTLKIEYSERLVALPEALGRCSGLQAIRALRSKQLVHLPESIGQLGALRELSLRETNVDALPESIGDCAALEVLDVINHELIALPRTLGKLAKLRELKLGKRAYEANIEWLRAALPGCEISLGERY